MKRLSDIIRDSLIGCGRYNDYIVGMPDDDGNTAFGTCDITNGLYGDMSTVTITLLKRNIFGRVVNSCEYQADVCFEVLDFEANGQDYIENDRGYFEPIERRRAAIVTAPAIVTRPTLRLVV